MSDSMGRAMYEAAKEGNEVELRRLIGLGWSVNWHNPEVRRRMCFAWALASSPPLLLRSPSPPTRRRPTRRQISPQLAARSAAALAVPPPRRPAELCTRVLVARRAPHPRVLVHAPRVMALYVSGVCTVRIHCSDDGLNARARRVRPPPPRVRGDRGQRHGGKSRACPPPSIPKHMPWVSFHVVISVVSCLQNLGYTALHCAAYWGRLAITELLLELGADPTLRSKEGKTALDYAREEGKIEVVALLSEPRYADEDRPTNATRTQRPRRLGHTPSTDCWPTANERRRLAMGCCREDATADLPRR